VLKIFMTVFRLNRSIVDVNMNELIGFATRLYSVYLYTPSVFN
jgi:hypothetical protein